MSWRRLSVVCYEESCFLVQSICGQSVIRSSKQITRLQQRDSNRATTFTRQRYFQNILMKKSSRLDLDLIEEDEVWVSAILEPVNISVYQYLTVCEGREGRESDIFLLFGWQINLPVVWTDQLLFPRRGNRYQHHSADSWIFFTKYLTDHYITCVLLSMLWRSSLSPNIFHYFVCLKFKSDQ